MRDLEANVLSGAEETKLQYDYIEKAKTYVQEKEAELGRKLTCCVKTFGCQMNARDSDGYWIYRDGRRACGFRDL